MKDVKIISEIFDYLKKRPMLLSGILGSLICILGFYSERAVFFCGILLILVFYLLLWKRVEPSLILAVVFLFVISVSSILNVRNAEKVSSMHNSELKASFLVTEEPKFYENYYSVLLEVQNCKGLSKGTKVIAFGKQANFGCGDIIDADATFKSVEDEYKAFDYSEKIYITANIKNSIVAKENADFVSYNIQRLRNFIEDTLFMTMEYDEAATVNAIILGDRSYISKEFDFCIKATGLSHIMAVSGMHLSIIISFVMSVFGRFFKNRKFKAFLIFAVVLFVMALCGFTKSVLRAGVCYIILAAGLLVGRDNTPENSLGAAVVLILIAEPFSILSVSFLLSVLSTLGIVAAATPIIKYLDEYYFSKYKILSMLASSVTITVIALIFTLPISIYFFGYTSTVAVFTNLLVSYPVNILLCISAVGIMVFSFAPFIGETILRLASFVAKYVNLVIIDFGSLPFAVINLGNTALILSIILLLFVILGLFACKVRLYMIKSKEIKVRKAGKESNGKNLQRKVKSKLKK